MPIASTDIKYRLSGGASNNDPLLSLGGDKSSNDAPANLLDVVTGAESAAGDIEYRCEYVHNAHATLTLELAKIWILANTPSAGSDVAIGLGTSALNGTEQTVANESTAPAGVAFLSAADEANAINLGSIPPGQHRAIWIRRTVTAGAAATNDSVSFRVKGDTAA